PGARHRRAGAPVPARAPGPGLRAGQLHVGCSPRPHGGGPGGPSLTHGVPGMSRIVIYGEYPPSPDPAAEATMELVRGHLAGGADVEVVSPLPSAAHHNADLATVQGAALLARLTPGADLELALDPALLAKGRGRRAPAQVLLALAVRRARHSTVRLGPLGGPAGRGRLWLVLGHADSVVAASELDAVALARAGIDRSRLSARAAAVWL